MESSKIKTMKNDIVSARAEYENARARGGGVNHAQTRLMNTLFNYAKDIEAMLGEWDGLNKKVGDLIEENNMLSVSLSEADARLKEAPAVAKKKSKET